MNYGLRRHEPRNANCKEQKLRDSDQNSSRRLWEDFLPDSSTSESELLRRRTVCTNSSQRLPKVAIFFVMSFSILQKLPGWSSSTPMSHSFFNVPSGTQDRTLHVALAFD